jgi:polyisoprenoid-binding protein YceI
MGRNGLPSSAVWAAVIALAAGGASGQPREEAPSPPPGAYQVEPEHTEILFGVSHFGFTMYYGLFSDARGALLLDSADPTRSRLDVQVPVSSLITPSVRLSEELEGPQWLNAAAFPDMSYRSTHITMTGPRSARVDGELTLHGVTRPLTLTATFNRAGENPVDHAFTIGFEGRGVVRRSDFGVSAYKGAIGDDVHITISAAFERTPDAR